MSDWIEEYIAQLQAMGVSVRRDPNNPNEIRIGEDSTTPIMSFPEYWNCNREEIMRWYMQPKEGNIRKRMTPREFSLREMGYVPDGIPETWDEIDRVLLSRYPGYKPGEINKINAYGSGLDTPKSQEE